MQNRREYRSFEEFRVVYRNRLVEKLNRLIKEEQENWNEIYINQVFEDLIEVERMSIAYQTKKCKKELEEMKAHKEELEENIMYYYCAIRRVFEEIRILDEKMIPENLKDELLPLPEYRGL